MAENNLQKYENWRAITEADYVTMFIKTWFTYISILRNTFPNINVFTEDGKARGDKPFLNSFVEEVLPFVRARISVGSFDKFLFEMYPLCSQKVFLTFPQYFFQTFYRYNVDYHYRDEEKTEEQIYILDLRLKDKFYLALHFMFKFNFRSKPYQEEMKARIDLKQLVEEVNNTLSVTQFDEARYLKALYEAVGEAIRNNMQCVLQRVQDNKDYSQTVKEHFKNACNKVISSLTLSFEPNFRKVHEVDLLYPEDKRIIFKQAPFQLFYMSYVDNDYLSQRTYYDNLLLKNGLNWFSDFVYQLRNALFHEIIDPLDKDWQLIYKNAYLILKEITDIATDYSIQKEVSKLLKDQFLTKDSEQFREQLQNLFETTSFILHNYELVNENIKIDDIEIADIQFENFSISTDQVSGFFKCKVNLIIEGRARISNYDLSYYDKEDDKYQYIVESKVKFQNAKATTELEGVVRYDLRSISETLQIVSIKTLVSYIDVSLSDDDTDNSWENIYPE